MAASNVNLYEGMFLLSQAASANLAEAIEHVRDILTRATADVLVLKKWDERKLAYPIRGQKRGVYLLAYFRVKSTQIANIDRDCNLSETVLRSLIIKADHIGEAELELAKKEEAFTSTEAKLRSESQGAASESPEPAATGTEQE